MRYWSLWNAHVPIAKCVAPDKKAAISNFRHHGYGGASEGSVDETNQDDYSRLQAKALPSVGERKKEEEEW
jgi:hypothetical protein